jgi:hypothetical protein
MIKVETQYHSQLPKHDSKLLNRKRPNHREYQGLRQLVPSNLNPLKKLQNKFQKKKKYLLKITSINTRN